MSPQTQTKTDADAPEATNNILAGYSDVKPFADEVERCERTVRRWMDEPGGLPYVQLGNRRLIHIETAREWIFRKLQTRNPKRSKPARKKSARRKRHHV
jgi:hypothetical protein